MKFRLKASRTTARQRKPAKAGMYVMSATHRRLGAAAQSCVRLDGVLAARYDPALWWLPLAPAYAVKTRVSHRSSYPLASGVNPFAG